MRKREGGDGRLSELQNSWHGRSAFSERHLSLFPSVHHSGSLAAFPFTNAQMSRLIVKNLPAYLTSDQLKEHFLQKKGPGGDITDLKVARQSDGRSRRFAFIGFRTEDEAAKSQQWFDRTYLGTTKISVQLAEVRGQIFCYPRSIYWIIEWAQERS